MVIELNPLWNDIELKACIPVSGKRVSKNTIHCFPVKGKDFYILTKDILLLKGVKGNIVFGNINFRVWNKYKNSKKNLDLAFKPLEIKDVSEKRVYCRSSRADWNKLLSNYLNKHGFINYETIVKEIEKWEIDCPVEREIIFNHLKRRKNFVHKDALLGHFLDTRDPLFRHITFSKIVKLFRNKFYISAISTDDLKEIKNLIIALKL